MYSEYTYTCTVRESIQVVIPNFETQQLELKLNFFKKEFFARHSKIFTMKVVNNLLQYIYVVKIYSLSII
jgi:hypothetical protein